MVNKLNAMEKYISNFVSTQVSSGEILYRLEDSDLKVFDLKITGRWVAAARV